MGLARWLRQARGKGRTAPKSRLNQMKWLATHMGLDAPIDDQLVVDQGAELPGHVERQATPLRIKMWFALDMWSQSANACLAMLACAWQALLLGVMRFAHLQRSAVAELDDDFVEFYATRGKCRQGGKRRPFWWRMPRKGISGADVGGSLVKLWRAAAGQDVKPQYLLFDMVPERARLEEMSGFQQKAMSAGRFSASAIGLAPCSLSVT